MFDDLYKSAKRVNTEKTQLFRPYIQVDPSQKHLVTRSTDHNRLKAGYIVTLPDGTKVKLGK